MRRLAAGNNPNEDVNSTKIPNIQGSIIGLNEHSMAVLVLTNSFLV